MEISPGNDERPVLGGIITAGKGAKTDPALLQGIDAFAGRPQLFAASSAEHVAHGLGIFAVCILGVDHDHLPVFIYNNIVCICRRIAFGPVGLRSFAFVESIFQTANKLLKGHVYRGRIIREGDGRRRRHGRRLRRGAGSRGGYRRFRRGRSYGDYGDAVRHGGGDLRGRGLCYGSFGRQLGLCGLRAAAGGSQCQGSQQQRGKLFQQCFCILFLW